MQQHDNPRLIDIESLNLVLANLPAGASSAGQLALASRRLYADPSVINFFESIPEDTRFQDKKDVMLRAQAAAALEEEVLVQPDDRSQDYDV